jgi:DNA-binding NarL/FixJ family response regulator
VPSKRLIADDSEIVRRGIRQILSFQNEFEMVGETQDFVQTSPLIGELNADVVVLDVHMPGEITFLSNAFKSQLRGSRLFHLCG